MLLEHKLMIGGISTSLMGILIGWIGFPFVLKLEIHKAKYLLPGTESREFWEKIPFTMDFKVYVMNLTNHMEVQNNGAIPIVQEVGPYFFDEIKEKAEVVDYEEDDAVSYHMKNTYIFNKEKSAPLTGSESLTIPHPFLMGFLTAVEREKQSVLPMVNTAIPNIFNNPETVFRSGTPLEFLFEGLLINCTSKDFQTSAICSVLKKVVKDMLPTDEPKVFKYSLFGALNATSSPVNMKVSRGKTDMQKIGRMVAINGKKKLTYWRGRPCNDLMGTDSTIFPPFTTAENPPWTYSFELCRSLKAKYVGERDVKGHHTLRFIYDFGDVTTDPNLKCYCASDTNCVKKGAMELMPCTGAPVLASLPHFYNGHEDYFKGVQGLHPDMEKHIIFMDIEPYTGTPLRARKRVMFSMPIHKIKNINLTEKLPDVVLPFVWVEEGMDLDDEFLDKLDRELFTFLRIVGIMKWGMLFGGSVVLVGAMWIHFKKKKGQTVTPTSAASRNSGSPEKFEAGNKPQAMNMDMGHSNFGFIS